MTTLLITGSRVIPKAGIAYAKRIVARAQELGWDVVVGDAPGIDAAVIGECDRLHVKVTVYGAFEMRRRSKTGKNIVLHTSFPKRDKHMAKICDVCQAIWNGSSRGTKLTYQAAQDFDKAVYVKEFPTSED